MIVLRSLAADVIDIFLLAAQCSIAPRSQRCVTWASCQPTQKAAFALQVCTTLLCVHKNIWIIKKSPQSERYGLITVWTNLKITQKRNIFRPYPQAPLAENGCRIYSSFNVITLQEIERFINEAEHGVIYVNLGSTVKDSTLAGDKLNELLSTFGKLPLRVLWKWDGGNLQLPRNVMTMKWFPQYDILSKYAHMCLFSNMGGCLLWVNYCNIWRNSCNSK